MSAYNKHLYGTVRYSLFGLKWSEFCRVLPPAKHPSTLLEEKPFLDSRDMMKAWAMMTLMSQLEITRICITGDKEHVCLRVCVSSGKKLRVQPLRLQGVTALIIPSSTVEAEAAVKKMVEIPDHKLGKYTMEQQIASFFCASLTGWCFLQLVFSGCTGWMESEKNLLLPLWWINFIFTSFEAEN